VSQPVAAKTNRPSSRTRRERHLELEGLRINAGLSRAELGARIGMSAETIRLAELGFLPGPGVQLKIAKEFGRRPLDLWPMERQRAGR